MKPITTPKRALERAERSEELELHRVLHYGVLNDFKRAHWFINRNVDVAPVLSAMSPRLILEAALNGLGIAMLPEMLCVRELKQKQLIEVLPQNRVSKIPISIVHRKSLSEHSAISKFIALIVKYAKRSDTWLRPPLDP